jgi:pimeloyl-ACP methyl ester carboxylesterase
MNILTIPEFGAGISARVVHNSQEKVLWIHGYTLDSSIWKHLWQHLPRWQHIAIDLPGHGLSAPIENGETLLTLADRIGELAVSQQISHLVGLSFGGQIALQIAIQFPQFFTTLILASPGLGGGMQDSHAQSRNLELIKLYRQQGRGSWLTEKWMQSPPDIFKGAAQHPQLWQELQQLIEQHSWQELQDNRMNAITNHQQSKTAISQIQSATLLLIGENDMASFKRNAELIRRAIVTCDRQYIANTGHLCIIESPSAVASLINQHLCAHSKSTNWVDS